MNLTFTQATIKAHEVQAMFKLRYGMDGTNAINKIDFC